MKVPVAMLLIAFSILNGADDFKLQFTGVTTRVFDELGEMVDVTVRREIPKACYDLELNPDTVFGGHYAGSHVPEPCKIAHVSTLGHLYPMRLAEGVETVGELEVLAFIKAAGKEPGSRLLVDSRGSRWFERITIPSAVNIPFIYLKEAGQFADEFTAALAMLGAKKEASGYDFSSAKNVLIFCNGPWCASSPEAVKALLKLGYPPAKIFWYRGGLHDWTGLGMTVQAKENHY